MNGITIEGTYEDGHVELDQRPEGIQRARVKVHFEGEQSLSQIDSDTPPSERRAGDATASARGRARAFLEWTEAHARRLPRLPAEAFDRETLYEGRG